MDDDDLDELYRTGTAALVAVSVVAVLAFVAGWAMRAMWGAG